MKENLLIDKSIVYEQHRFGGHGLFYSDKVEVVLEGALSKRVDIVRDLCYN